MKKASGIERLLMTTDNLGGVWTYTMELLSELDKYDIKTVLAVMGTPLNSDQVSKLAAFTNVKLHYGKYKLEWMEDPWEDIDEAGEWLLNIRDEFHPQLVHLNSFSFGALHWGVPVVTVAHSDVISWWRSVLKCAHPKRLNEYYKRVKFGLENSSFVIAPSRAMLSDLNDIYGIFQNQKVIYNARTDYSESVNKESMIFSMGRIWDTAKNISLVVNSAPLLKWKVYLAGPLQDPVTEEVTGIGNVEFLGNLSGSNIFRYLSRSSIFIHPAKYEPFGMGPLEAALSGCALVLGRIESLKEIWGTSAIYVDPEDSSELIETVNHLIKNEDRLKFYQAKAKEKAKEFTTENMVKEYLSVYKSVLTRLPLAQKVYF